jgi:selenocysteine lyase/cysteine desulfurase
MDSRRNFLKKASAVAGALAVSPMVAEAFHWQNNVVNSEWPLVPPSSISSDDDFWSWIRSCFTVSPNLINLNNGGVSPQPKQVQDAHIRNYQLANEGPSFYMWRTLDNGREMLRTKLAQLIGCTADEVAINRNSTEGLNTIIFGLNLKAGDEVVLSKYDYPNMMNAWKQREKRDGIKLVWIDPVLPFESDDEIVQLYAKAITAKTKIVHVTHLINWTGQLTPARKIVDLAHAKGCEVIVDGAHSFAHFNHKVTDLDADYYATSLHKWLCAPFGSGLLYIKKNKIKNIWALLSSEKPDGDDIRKFETLGTRSFASEMAISTAIDFHLMIGAQRKEERLRFLKNYWCQKVKDLKGVHFSTSFKNEYSCAIAHVGIDGWKGIEMDMYLMKNKKVHTVGIDYERLNGIRVAPSIYTSTKDLDFLVEGIKEMTEKQPPGEKE